ncbi:MAG: type II secretion system protein [Clostridiaceae bacterium]
MENVLTTNQKKRRKGFTLIELIIVLAVMAIIAAIAIPNLAGVKDNAAKKTDEQSAKTIQRSIEVLMADGTIKYDSEMIVTITPKGENVEPTIEGLATNNGAGELATSLKGLKAPQQKDKVVFIATIKADGAVSVKTDKVTQQSGS